MAVVADSYVPPSVEELCVWKREDEDSYLVMNPAGPNWFVTDKMGVFLTSLGDGALSVGEAKRLVQSTGAQVDIESINRFFGFLNDIHFFDEGRDGDIAVLSAAFLNITGRCNLRCVYCLYDANGERQVAPDASADSWIGVIREIHRINPAAVVTITGGEPWLANGLFSILDTLCEVKLRTKVFTNGTLISDQDLDRLAGYDNLIQIQVSLDSVVDEENLATRTLAARRVMDGILKLKSRGLPVRVSCTVTKINIDSVQKLADFCGQHDLPYRFVKLFPTAGRAQESCAQYEVSDVVLAEKVGYLARVDAHNINVIKGYRRLHKRSICGLGRVLSIADNGNVYPCNHLNIDQFLMGNAFATPLGEIIANKNRGVASVPVDAIESCAKCEMRYLCGGECRATAYYQRGRLDAGTSGCGLLKEVIRDVLWKQCLDSRMTLIPTVSTGPIASMAQ